MKRLLFALAAVSGLGASFTATAFEQPGEAALRLADARQMADRALRAASDLHLEVSIVIVNREGRVLLSYRMDGSSVTNFELAERKAATAAAIGAPTSVLEEAVDGGKISLLSVPGVTAVGGGVPVQRGDKVVGGVGVSGGTPQDDEKIAKAALGA